MDTENATVRVPCTECGGELRNHEVLRVFSTHWSDGENFEQGGTHFQICRCKGCEHIRFREESWSTMERDPETGEYDPTITVYPEVARSERKAIEIFELPKSVSRIYSETVVAFNAGAPILAGAGLRAIVEAICIDQKVSGRNLQERIDDLVAKGMLAKPQAELLHEERYIGNAALHEILPPSTEELDDGLAIVEGLLSTIFVLPRHAARIRAKREGKK